MSRRHLVLSCLAIPLLVLLAGSPAAAATTSHHTDYVALGDSYSAGVGAPGQVGPCQQSPYGYPGQWAGRHRPRTFVNLTCGGATTDDVRNLQIPLLSRQADLISITIGGNDAGFGETLLACLTGTDATCAAVVAAAETDVRATLPAKLDATYAAIHHKAPRARVVVLDYPLLFDTTSASCPSSGMSVAKRRALNDGARVLDRTIRNRVRAARLTFAEVRGTFAGHGICSTRPYLNGIVPVPASDSFHPNLAGYTFGYLPALTRAAR